MGMLKDFARGAFIRVVSAAGVNALYRRRNARKLAILFYHGVSVEDVTRRTHRPSLHLPRETFRRQLAYLRKLGYRFVTLTEAVEALAGDEPLPERLVTLTFDDGFRNVVRVAYPLMQEFGAKGCVYVVAGLPGTGRALWPPYVTALTHEPQRSHVELDVSGEKLSLPLTDAADRLRAEHRLISALSALAPPERDACLRELCGDRIEQAAAEDEIADWDDLRTLDPGVLEVGGHTQNHVKLRDVTDDEMLRRELVCSKAAIEEAIGRPVDHFCYPAGSYDGRVVEAVRCAGYVSATTIRYGFNGKGEDVFTLKRAGSSSPLSHFKACLSGAFGVYSALGRWKGSR